MIAALPAIAVALTALLILLAFLLLIKPVTALLEAAANSGIPLIGIALNWLVREQATLIVRAYNAVFNWAISAVQPLSTVLYNTTTQLWRYTNANNFAHVAIFETVRRVAYLYVPRAVEQAQAYTEAVRAQTIGYVNDIANYLDHFIRALHEQTIGYVDGIANYLDHFIRALHEQTIGYVDGIANYLNHQAQALHAQALGFAEDAFGRAIEFEQKLYGEGIKYADAIWVRARDYAQALHATSIAYTVAAVGAVAVRVARIETSKCQRFCNPLGDLGEVLQDLQGLGVAALFVGLAAEMARDPHGSARMLNDTLGPPLRGAIDAIKGEAGIR